MTALRYNTITHHFPAFNSSRGIKNNASPSYAMLSETQCCQRSPAEWQHDHRECVMKQHQHFSPTDPHPYRNQRAAFSRKTVTVLTTMFHRAKTDLLRKGHSLVGIKQSIRKWTTARSSRQATSFVHVTHRCLHIGKSLFRYPLLWPSFVAFGSDWMSFRLGKRGSSCTIKAALW